MKNHWISMGLIVLFSACATKRNNQGDWTALIQPNSTQGWHTYGKTQAGTAWTVSEGILRLDPTVANNQKGDLATNDKYENFHLKYEWKISKNGNSGVMFNVNEDPKYKHPYLTGPEMQVLDNDRHPDAKIFKHRAGDLYDLIPSAVETVRPAGEWNKAEIVLNGSNLQFFLNGKEIVKTKMWDADWDKMVAGSKFKNMPDFGKFRSGKIVLQDHGDAVSYKNIIIKKL